jgi:protein-disulfide isomerase
MTSTMRFTATVLTLTTIIGGSPHAAAPAANPDAAQVDAIVRKLESSGALDAAIDRALDRYAKRKEQERQAEETRKQAELGKSARPLDLAQDHIRGSPTADVSLLEYSDFECPFCKSFHGTPKALVDRYGGRVNWALRNFPLAFHNPVARTEALAAECVARLAGNDAFWKFSDVLFANTKSNGDGLPPQQSVEKLAAGVGVKEPELAKCMSDPATGARVDQDIADGTAAGVTGTPTTVIRNNRTGVTRAIVGAQPADAVARAIDQVLGGNQ